MLSIVQAAVEPERVQRERNEPSKQRAPKVMGDQVCAAALLCDAEHESENQADGEAHTRPCLTALVRQEIQSHERITRARVRRRKAPRVR